MQKHIFASLLLVFLVGNLFSQQLSTAPYQSTPEQDIPLDVLQGITLNKLALCNRQAIIDDYKNVYLTSEVSTADLGWTGSVATCTPGTTSALSKTNVLNRINYFRKLVGLSNSVVLDQNAYEANCQAAALIMDANDNLSHTPPNNWTCWTQAGSNGAGSSNLALGAHSATAISLYMADPGTGNEPAGHRRWVLYSRATKLGTGSTSTANALFVFGPTVIPPVLPPFIAFPSEGFFPRSHTPTRWSFGIPGANFSNAVVTVKNEANDLVSITQNPYVTGYGDNTLTWEMPGATVSFANKEDVVYTVTVSGIANAPATSYTYQTFLIHEETPTVAFTKLDPNCQNNGTVSANFSAGGKAYVWSNGQSGAALSGLLPGTYTVTVTDKADCTTVASVELLDQSISVIAPGDASTSTKLNCDGNIQLNLNTTGALNLGTNQIVGWWITQDAPVADSFTDQASLNTALNSAVVNPATVTPGLSSFMFKASNGTSLAKTFSCATQLDPNKTYYATPFVSQNDSPAPSAYSNNTTIGNIVIQDLNGGVPGETAIPVKVWQTPSSANLKKVCIQMTYPGFATLNDLDIRLRDPYGTEVYLTYFFPGSSNGNGGINACYVDDNSGVNIFNGCNGSCYTGLLNSAESFAPFSSIDPNGTWTLLIKDDFNQGWKPNFISAALEFDEPSYAIHFPEVDYSKCVMGDPIHFSCAETDAPATPSISGQTQYCGLVAGTLSAGNSYSTYLWSNGQTTSSIQIQQPGTYSVTVSNAVGCTATSSATILLNNLPSTSISGDADICQGQSTMLNAGAGFSGYSWNTGQTTGNITVQNSGTYSVTVTDVHTCTTTASITVNVSPLPTASISGGLSFCPGSSTTLTAPAGYAGYLWSTNQTTQSIPIQQAGTYQLTITNAQGCTASNSATVTALPAAVVNISGDQSFCAGKSATLDAGAGFATYTWNTGQTAQSISVSQGGSYVVTVTNAQGCSGTASQSMTVHQNPDASISGILNFCPGFSTVLFANPAFSNYIWSTGSTSNAINISVPGPYSVTITASFGCTGTGSVMVAQLDNPTVNLGPDQTINQGQLLNLNASGPGLSYLWSTGATTSSITVQTMGIYSVTVTNATGCTATDEIKVDIISKVSEPESAFKIEVFPNPAVDFIQFRCLDLDISRLIVKDIHGRTVLENQDFITKGSWQNLDISQLPMGSYILILKGERFSSSIRFVKARP